MKAEEAGPSSNAGVFQFDVFLSFSGKDARHGITSHLYKELNQLGVITFMDSKDLQKGERISQLFQYMKSSQIFVPILSEKYAQSKWCLLEAAEMVKIVAGDQQKMRLIIPVFYYVDPSADIKDEGGLYQSAVMELRNSGKLEDQKVKECIGALKTICSISGFHLKRDADVCEAKLVTRICKHVQELFGRVPFGVQPTGFDSQIGELITMLEAQSDGVCIIGICGMGGIGKTTIAKAIRDKLFSQFDGSSFIEDVDAIEKLKGLPAVQKELICDVLNLKKGSISIATVDKGRNIIKQRLNSKRVLIVLDNIVKLDQLQQLSGYHICRKALFGKGSKIIVTTRDKAVLRRYGMEEHQIYYPEELKDPWPLKLFYRHAFIDKPPSFELVDLAKEVAEIAGGLPLVLVQVGSVFAGLFTKEEWEGELEKIRKNKGKDILEKLKWSYDGLDNEQKCVFLDIACFFVGAKMKRATYLWDDCSPGNAIRVLRERNLIIVDDEDRFRMHDLIQEMGRWIVSGEGNLGHCMNRLCYRNEETITSMNSQEKGKVEGIVLDMEEECTETNLTTKEFVDMLKLRMLHLKFVKFLEAKIDHFPKSLKWLQWRGCEMESVTFDGTSFKKLAILDLSQSSIYKLTLTNKLDRLKVLDLSSCYIDATPNFASTPNLEKLFLDDCGKLREAQSICRLKKLTTLSMRNCEFVKELPEKHNLSKLEELNLQGCQQLQSLPPLPSSLKTLILQGCKELKPVHGFQNLESMELLDMDGCENINFTLMSSLFKGKTFSHLEELCASACKIPSEDENFSFIVPLDSASDPLRLQQLQCYGDGSKSNNPSNIYIKFCVKDMENNLVISETKFSCHRDIDNEIGGQYGWCYTVSFSEYDDINCFPELYWPCSICVSTADNFPLISVHILLRNAHRWNRNYPKVGHEVTNSRRMYAEQNQPLPSMNEAESVGKVVKQISLKPPRTIHKPGFDVFLSFRGRDTRNGFTSHLNNALCQRGISTFIDSEDLKRGERIAELFNYIEASKIFVPVLSEGYADSRWRLREITKMVECGRLIIPIFFHVDPWDVRKQSGPFEAAFQKHESDKRVGGEDLTKWKDALRAVGMISGYVLQNDTSGNEAELIRKVVKQISLKMELPFNDEGMMRDLNDRQEAKLTEPSSSSSPAKTIYKRSFDVFLSFRGVDTRKGFTSHLYYALCQRGISTFMDELERGERIEELFNYIEASKIFVPVLSKGYANSRWCLREITKMVECGRLIIPIFFHVDPWDVRKQSGLFEAAFERHESDKRVGEEDLRKWKDALGAVGQLSGYSIYGTDGNEAALIQRVVERISQELNKTARPITEHIVGMDSHIDIPPRRSYR